MLSKSHISRLVCDFSHTVCINTQSYLLPVLLGIDLISSLGPLLQSERLRPPTVATKQAQLCRRLVAAWRFPALGSTQERKRQLSQHGEIDTSVYRKQRLHCCRKLCHKMIQIGKHEFTKKKTNYDFFNGMVF